MSKVIVKWNMPHVWSIGTGRKDSSVVQFIPGTNQKELSEIKCVIDHPEVQARMKAEIYDKKLNKMVKKLEIIMPKEDEESEGEVNGENVDETLSGSNGLADLNGDDAVKLIKETYNLPLLREWAEDEARKKPSVAIAKQIEKIEAEREGDDEENSQE